MIQLDYELSAIWTSRAKYIDFKALTYHDFVMSFFNGDQIMVVNAYDCSLRGLDIPLLDFSKWLFLETKALVDGAVADVYYTNDEDEKIHLLRTGDKVAVTSSHAEGAGTICDYSELLNSSKIYAQRLIETVTNLYPEVSMNTVFRELYLST